MKIIYTLLFLSLSLFSANIDNYAKEMGFERDYNTALAKAKKENKVIAMVLSADYCPWCRKFERRTIESDTVKPKLDVEFVTLVVDNKYDISTFPKKFHSSYTPFVNFINPHDETIIEQSAGYVKKKDFLSTLNKVQEMYKAKK